MPTKGAFGSGGGQSKKRREERAHSARSLALLKLASKLVPTMIRELMGLWSLWSKPKSPVAHRGLVSWVAAT